MDSGADRRILHCGEPTMKRLIKLGDALSQLINAVVFNGSPNESLSGRSCREQLWTEKFIDELFWFDPYHCENAHLNDLHYAVELLKQEERKYANKPTQ